MNLTVWGQTKKDFEIERHPWILRKTNDHDDPKCRLNAVF